MSKAGMHEVSEVVRRPSRLRALAELEANAESSADALDRIARIACRVLDVPVALVNLVGEDRQRFVACSAQDEPWASTREMPVTAGFCPFALGAGDAFAIGDTREQHAANPAVQQFGVVAYAGVPLRTAGGEPIGTLCAIDFEPRDWDERDLGLLADLAANVVAELQLLAATRLIARQQSRMHTLATVASADDVTGEVLRALEPLGATGVRVLDESDRPLAETEEQVGDFVVAFAGDRTLSAADRDYLAAVAGIATRAR